MLHQFQPQLIHVLRLRRKSKLLVKIHNHQHQEKRAKNHKVISTSVKHRQEIVSNFVTLNAFFVRK